MIILACDLGGTRMKIGVVRDGAVLAQTSVPANSKAGLVPGLPALKAAWRCNSSPTSSLRPPTAPAFPSRSPASWMSRAVVSSPNKANTPTP